uniref:Uncharacterized protein n=1 Tax=Sphaerodactylus townsendi TaxID=933632 RepID=A0ACB8FB29_9SAUR
MLAAICFTVGTKEVPFLTSLLLGIASRAVSAFCLACCQLDCDDSTSSLPPLAQPPPSSFLLMPREKL